MSGSAGGQVLRSLVTEIRFKLAGFREAEAAFQSLQARARQVGDVRFRVSGLEQAQAALARLRASARSAIGVPVGRIAAPALAAPGMPAMPPVRIGGVAEARGALEGLRAMAQGAAAAVASIGAAFTVSNLLKAGDQMTANLSQLRAELEGTGVAAEGVYERIFAMGRVTGVSVDAGVQAFTRMNNAVKDTGATTDQVLQVIQGIQKAGAVSGASARDVGEVLRQLGQSFGSGKLSGDELRVLTERMGPLAREIAKEMGVAAGKMKELGSKGALTTEKVFPALRRAVQGFEDKFGRLNLTLERARGVSGVVFTRFLADLDHALDLTPTLARGLLRISEWADGLRSKLPAVRAFVRDLGGIRSVLEVIGISAGLATAAFYRFGLSLIVPGAVVLGIAAVGAGLQDLWYWTKGRPSLLGDFFGDFEPVRQRIAAAFDFAAGKFAEVRAEVLRGLGFETTNEALAEAERRVVAFADTTRREWQTLRDFFASDGSMALVGDTFRGLSGSAESMWSIVGPIIRGLVGGPSDMAREWGTIRAAIGDPLKAVAGFFEDVATRASNLYARITELAFGLRKFLGDIGFINPTPGNGQLPDAVARQRQRDAGGAATPDAGPGLAPAAPGTPGMGRLTPGMSRDPVIQGLLNPSSFDPGAYMRDLPGRMGRAQTIAASQAVTINAPVTVNATGVSGAEVAAATQKGMGRAMESALDGGDALTRNIGLNFARTELATT